ncbi:indolethylamine N-methyltransferase [Acomys russatus]|uniref:indolethylamine N-methyltransferase n=1 Tax=Acomys russatus TaxID=60746 RepID=UPI0021E34233|nr:indolethylamine N-methyltransferase [Acomys russatus]
MEGKVYLRSEDYEQHFSPRDYLTTFYSFDSGMVAEREIVKFSLQNLHQTFSAGGIKGDVLIDIGSGPTIYHLLSACEAFREIIVSDYTPQNLQELQKWLKKEPGAYDWSAIVQHVCELEGDRSKWQEKEAKLQRTVTHVLKCDVTKTPLLGSAQVPLADCVLTCLAMECACPDLETYQAALCRLAGLLKPGGHLVTMVTLRFQHYMVGPKKFAGVYLEKETVEKAVQNAGCQVLKCSCVPLSYSQAYCVNDGMCFVVARKKPQCLKPLADKSLPWGSYGKHLKSLAPQLSNTDHVASIC